MALYLVIHEPDESKDENTLPPSQLAELAQAHGSEGAQPQWIGAWSPDLHDDRLFTTWESVNAEAILTAIDKFGFLNNMKATAIQVRAWGPNDVLTAPGSEDE